MTEQVIIRNLLPGQYQIDNLVFGKHTTVRVETFDIKPYDINAQDFQTSRADEMRFGWDQLKPTTIDITFHVLNNKMRPGYENLIPNFWAEMPTVAQFQEAWRADDVRYNWGQMKALYVCGKDGITRTVYGRPGHFTYAKDSEYTEDVQCLGEFRRADTSSYSVNERGVILTNQVRNGTAPLSTGDAPSWFRILFNGPAVKPKFEVTGTMFGDINFGLDYDVADNEVIEFNSYPWSRRVVSSNGQNLSGSLNGDTPYMDRLRFDHKSTLGIAMSADSGMTDDTKAAILFKDAYQVVG